MPDTRPVEEPQDSFEWYGKFVLERYGKQAFECWLAEKYRKYGGETRQGPPIPLPMSNKFVIKRAGANGARDRWLYIGELTANWPTQERLATIFDQAQTHRAGLVKAVEILFNVEVQATDIL